MSLNWHTFARGLLPVGVFLVAFGGVAAIGEWTNARPNSVEVTAIILARGTTSADESWEFQYQETPRGTCIALQIAGRESLESCGFDIPGTTEIGFSAGMNAGQGSFFLFGLTSARVAVVVAESETGNTEQPTLIVPSGSSELVGARFFLIERPPVDDVNALIGLDADGKVVQRIPLRGP
jgi:hypothetical protein